jgi:3-oxoacyl-(acyl-carrier-protein) synthase/acyl carrier protein
MNFLEYVFSQVKEQRLAKSDALDLLRWMQARGLTARLLEGGVDAATAVDAGSAACPELLRFEEYWQEQALAQAATSAPDRSICFLSSQAGQRQVEAVLRQLNPQAHVTFVSQGLAFEQHDDRHFTVLTREPRSYEQALARIVQEHGTPDAIFYLCPVESPEAISDCSGIALLAQAMVKQHVPCPRVLLAGAWADVPERSHVDSWIGFTRSLRPMLPRTWLTVVAEKTQRSSSGADSRFREWTLRLCGELGEDRPEQVMYEEGRRHIGRIKAVLPGPPRVAAEGVIRRGGTYLITGGTGGLGRLLAQHVARKYAGNVILTGRSELDDARCAELRKLEELGGRALYVQADVCNEQQMVEVLTRGRERFGSIQGVFHAAGVGAWTTLLDEDLAEFEQVLDPKVRGSLILDRVLRREQVDFICYFSSSAAVLGDHGACAYAVGNRFQLAYARYAAPGDGEADRTHRLAVCWPLWREGGMRVGDEQQTRSYLQGSGQTELETSEGLAVLECLLQERCRHQLVFTGYANRVRRMLGLEATANAPNAVAILTSDADLLKGTIELLRGLLSILLQIPRERIEEEASFERYGMDSVLAVQMVGELQKIFGPLPETVMFEYQNIRMLASYFMEQHGEALRSHLAPQQSVRSATEQPRLHPSPPQRARTLERVSDLDRFDIAVIGLGGRYPQANDVDSFWENLKAGKDCIIEVPAQRWDHARYYDPEKGKVGKSCSRWGGFIQGVNTFDHAFFDISAAEALYMDPQERVFLEVVWHLFENAGYTQRRVQSLHQGEVGVYVGARAFVPSGAAIGYVASRVSRFLGLHGPSLVVDTYSASSMTAVHLACQALARGECQMAIAGGASILDIELFLAMGTALSTQQNRRSFSVGDGATVSDGVGAVLLKPLHTAVRDSDRILAVIKSTALNNNGGPTEKFPCDPVKVAGVIRTALERAQVHPRTVSCVETTGTGIPAGDYCEVSAYTRVFRERTQDAGFCALGSVKSNIGHCNAASGLSQLTKVVLQLHTGYLVPSIKTDPVNPALDLANSPFHLQNALQPWKRPSFPDSPVAEIPRRAVITSQGIDGTNVCVVLEEYRSAQEVDGGATGPLDRDELILLSARTREQLRLIAAALEELIGRTPTLALCDIAYTLSRGREAMQWRFATVARTTAELRSRLAGYVAGEAMASDSYMGEVSSGEQPIRALLGEEEESRLLGIAVAECDLRKLARLWVGGSDVQALYAGRGHVVSLPCYPFSPSFIPTRRGFDVVEENGLPARGADDPHPRLTECAVV